MPAPKPKRGDPLLTRREAAAMVGVSYGRWTQYVAKSQILTDGAIARRQRRGPRPRYGWLESTVQRHITEELAGCLPERVA